MPPSPPPGAPPHVIITGGSSGIGLAVAQLYAARGARLSLIARGQEGLDEARGSLVGARAVAVQSADVADASSLLPAIAGCEALLGPCDILVASAGIVEPGLFLDQSAESLERQIAVNLQGSMNSVRAVYPGMAARRSGRIMLVSSGAALIGIPGYAAYCASKSALRGFAEALRFEAAPLNVTIGICYPPDTQTPQLAAERRTRPPEAEVIMGAVKPWPAAAVAERLVAAIDRGTREEFFSSTLWALARLAPLVRPALLAWFDWRLRR
ncbi:SDR family oxidoreductase [Rhizobium sp. YIM 134829]|uniref:SDR family oxidoreductase n=1 Tax=Rhizobium sp. YIM 134829 TaxID=3390453 RepID=UPI00397A40B0